jgi:hypothetical protein
MGPITVYLVNDTTGADITIQTAHKGRHCNVRATDETTKKAITAKYEKATGIVTVGDETAADDVLVIIEAVIG